MINVLIVEDDPMVAKFNGLYLESIPGFKIIGFAKNAEEAMLSYQENRVDLILLDVYMGEKTGLEFLADLRREDDAVDVIIITAANDKQSVQTALRSGAVDYLIKPFSFERFEEALLQYRQKYSVMNDNETVSQEEIDSFLMKSERSQKLILELPKGLTIETLSRIVTQVMKFQEGPFSAAELSSTIGISRVSVRKYLNYLVEQNYLKLTIVYQKTGRPLNHFSIRLEKVEMLERFIL